MGNCVSDRKLPKGPGALSRHHDNNTGKTGRARSPDERDPLHRSRLRGARTTCCTPAWTSARRPPEPPGPRRRRSVNIPWSSRWPGPRRRRSVNIPWSSPRSQTTVEMIMSSCSDLASAQRRTPLQSGRG